MKTLADNSLVKPRKTTPPNGGGVVNGNVTEPSNKVEVDTSSGIVTNLPLLGIPPRANLATLEGAKLRLRDGNNEPKVSSIVGSITNLRRDAETAAVYGMATILLSSAYASWLLESLDRWGDMFETNYINGSFEIIEVDPSDKQNEADDNSVRRGLLRPDRMTESQRPIPKQGEHSLFESRQAVSATQNKLLSMIQSRVSGGGEGLAKRIR